MTLPAFIPARHFDADIFPTDLDRPWTLQDVQGFERHLRRINGLVFRAAWIEELGKLTPESLDRFFWRKRNMGSKYEFIDERYSREKFIRGTELLRNYDPSFQPTVITTDHFSSSCIDALAQAFKGQQLISTFSPP